MASQVAKPAPMFSSAKMDENDCSRNNASFSTQETASLSRSSSFSDESESSLPSVAASPSTCTSSGCSDDAKEPRSTSSSGDSDGSTGSSLSDSNEERPAGKQNHDLCRRKRDACAIAANDRNVHLAEFALAPQTSADVGPADRVRWQADAAQCAVCNVKFDIMNRRHHCRTCGYNVCNACSPSSIQLSGKLERVCTPCVVSGAGAVDLLPRLGRMCDKLHQLTNRAPPSGSLPVPNLPVQALALCEAAVEPIQECVYSAVKCQEAATLHSLRRSEELSDATEQTRLAEMKMERWRLRATRIEVKMKKELKEAREAEQASATEAKRAHHLCDLAEAGARAAEQEASAALQVEREARESAERRAASAEAELEKLRAEALAERRAREKRESDLEELLKAFKRGTECRDEGSNEQTSIDSLADALGDDLIRKLTECRLSSSSLPSDQAKSEQ